jgi:hypothetical protein
MPASMSQALRVESIKRKGKPLENPKRTNRKDCFERGAAGLKRDISFWMPFKKASKIFLL